MAEKNIEMNIKGQEGYDILRPRTTCEMVIDLLNNDTKELMGLDITAQGDDAFRALFYSITLDNRALINFTVKGNDGTPCTKVKISSDQFCDSKGNKVPTIETNNEGKISVFVDSLTVNAKISQYADLEDWEDSYVVEFGQIYDKEITLNRRNFLMIEKSQQLMFSNEIKRVDVSVCGGGGGASVCWPSRPTASGAGGAGGYSDVKESVSFNINELYSAVVGTGGAVGTTGEGQLNGKKGGTSSFLNVSADGGGGATGFGGDGIGGVGNGNGGNSSEYGGDTTTSGTDGTGYIYSSFTETVNIGGGGSGGETTSIYNGTSTTKPNRPGGKPNGGYGGGCGGTSLSSGYANDGEAGKKYGGGGGGGGGLYDSGKNRGTGGDSKPGGQGCVAIRMYTAQVLLNK